MGRPTYKQFMMPNSAGTGLASGVGSSSTTYDEAGDVTAITEGPGINLYLTRDSGGHVLTATSNKNMIFYDDRCCLNRLKNSADTYAS